jgi:hypothetical protein
MVRKKWIHYGLVLLGVFLLVGSLAVGIGGFRYEFTYESSTENPADWDRPLYEYDQLPANEQQVIDSAINGQRYVFNSQLSIPGARGSSLGGKEMMVLKQDTYYIFSHQTIFVSTTPAGLAAIALAFSGLVAIIEAIRRHHFPHRQYPWQSS